jgi:transposase
MKISLWAEIRRLHEMESLSQRAISQRLHCCRATVTKALAMSRAPDETKRGPRGSILDPYKPKIDALVATSPELSAVRIAEEIGQGPDGYRGGITIVRQYLRQIRPARGRVYQEVAWEPGQAMQVDWGQCGQVQIENTTRKVSVLVAVLCYSRLCYIEFTLSQKKAEFYRAIVHALTFYGGSPRRIIFDNLKAAVLNGSGRNACLHPEFLTLCGHFCLEPIACARRDPESKGIVENGVRYVKRNALEGRADQLTRWEDYGQLAVSWRNEVANVRVHRTTGERPVDRFGQERPRLRALPCVPFDTDEIVSTAATPGALVRFEGNRYSVPADMARKPLILRVSATKLRISYEGQEVAVHQRSYGRGQPITDPEHQLQALRLRRRARAHHLEAAFDALGELAREFHLKLQGRPVKTTRHLRRLLDLVRIYGRAEVLQAMARAVEYQTYDAAYVETILLQERRRRELPSPTPLCPRRRELIDEIDLEEPDPAVYDRLCKAEDVDPEQQEGPTDGQET